MPICGNNHAAVAAVLLIAAWGDCAAALPISCNIRESVLRVRRQHLQRGLSSAEGIILPCLMLLVMDVLKLVFLLL